MSVVNAIPLLLADEGYQISRSVRLRSSASAYFNRTPGSASSRTTWTYSTWIKLGLLSPASTGAINLSSGVDGNNRSEIRIPLTGGAIDFLFDYTSTAITGFLRTTQVFRDPSAWYHLLFVADTTQATASNRLKMYVNGVQVTSFSTATYPAQNGTGWINSANAHYIGNPTLSGYNYFDGYLTEVNFIDGQALTPSSFGETDAITGVWKPKKYTGTYGTNGFFLNFSDNSSNTATTIGKDYSGNGNNWTPNNISVTAGSTYDSMLDVPTLWADGGNGRGNYAVLNPLSGPAVPSTITNGNLTATTASSAFGLTSASMAMPSGKWYCEVKFSSLAIGALIGIRNSAEAPTSYVGGTSGSYAYYSPTGQKYNAATAATYGSSYSTSNTIGIAFDADAGSLTFYRDNVSQGVAYSSIPVADYVFAFSDEGTGSVAFDVNFGQRPFAYTPPTGFKALNTQNLPEPTIKKGNQWMDVNIWTGNGSARSITNSGSMQPDLVWVKSRTQAIAHRLVDAVRGAGNTLASNLTNAEFSDPQGVTSFNTNGFGIGTDTSYNQNGDTYVGWQWKEGATPGFDIVTYTGTGANRTVAHSLGVAPRMFIVKRRDTTGSWNVYHVSTGNTGAMYLELTNAFAADSTRFNNTSPTSTDFTVGTGAGINASGGTFVAYLFAEVAGFSRFGSYTGNGSSDGPMIFTGFRPRFILLKRTDTTGNWNMYDSARSPRNADTKVLYPNLSNSEDASTDHFDWLSNGFKMKSTNQNTNGGTFIYVAFAENPFKYSLAQ